MRFWALLLVPLAATAPALDVRVEQSTAHGTIVDPLSVNLTVTLTDRGTGQPPASAYDLFAFATAGSEKSITYPCALDRANDPAAPLGRYSCTVIVDHGGAWEFQAVVNQRRLGPKDPVTTLAQGKTTIEVAAGAVPVSRPSQGRGIKGRTWEVLVLWGHSAFAAIWLGCAALLAALAVPAARRRVSALGIHRLEERFELLVKGMWATAALIVASGTYLLLKQTAYKTPFSPSAVHGVFMLPYGRPYFLTLATKLVLYGLMLVGSVALQREAGRQLRSSTGTVTGQPPARDPWAPPATALVVAAGSTGIWMCVTLLKYFHELIEASRLR